MPASSIAPAGVQQFVGRIAVALAASADRPTQ
jgi:hypothetical protein